MKEQTKIILKLIIKAINEILHYLITSKKG